MNTYKVGFFGHREMYDLFKKEKLLTRIVEELVEANDVVEFFVGRSGDFDEIAASVVKSAKRRKGENGIFLTLVLPYASAKIEHYEKYYDDIIIPEELAFVHPKQSYLRRNEWIVERVDALIVNVEKSQGGAYRAMQYAERLGKKIINLSDFSEK